MLKPCSPDSHLQGWLTIPPKESYNRHVSGQGPHCLTSMNYIGVLQYRKTPLPITLKLDSIKKFYDLCDEDWNIEWAVLLNGDEDGLRVAEFPERTS